MPFQIPLLQIWNIKKKHWCRDSHSHCDWKYIPIKSIKVFLVFFFPFLQALKKLLYAIFWSENKENFQPEIFHFNLYKGCLMKKWLKFTIFKKKESTPDLVQVGGQIIGGCFAIYCILVKRFDWWWYVKSAKNLWWSYLVYSQIWLNLVMKYHQFNYITKLRKKKHTHTHITRKKARQERNIRW
jgi:hypothetical protein